MGSSAYEEVECTTIDGIAIRGWLFAVPGPAPAIVMSHGFNCVKEMTLPDVAEWFQRRGYNVLLYDARSVGASGGVPRNQPDLLQMAEDVSDIVTFVSNLKCVDPQRILLWGMSFGGTVSGCAAAVDHRPRALIMVCPLFSFVRPDRRRATFARLIQDRVSQLGGNEPLSLPPFNSNGENLAGFGGAGGPGGLEAYNLMRAAAGRGHPGFRDRITFQTFYKLALARPRELLDMIDERMAVMVVVPELDDISSPEEQRAAFEKLSTPRKRLHIARGKGHLSVVTGEGSEELLEAMDDFFREALRDDAG
ncbi:uncharacterized protein THITE_2107710 [Thermothielavioides terrestris NRRL 8126]|uniref:Serine aminopeptidase S33 domain-containing protein n=1 Tax=Thermothielavioides terrestris (strain ATCC 38088 / NRRL 8126) TaxID=578455 RepID=G2QUR2_THETT|nr:uncharacterized protein THITE_2107710 [Thermothielavioides terrestris NRRL 8126]AEO62907.1 hypothetical protein THITE_2107710 [Thermothielavioides terrestris NRRL 8126]